MGKLRKFAAALVIGLAAGGGAGVARGQSDGPVRVITVAPVERRHEGPAVRDLLADRLGSNGATAPVSAAEDGVARAADRLARVDSASRQYGPVRVAVYELADESLAQVLLQAVAPAGSSRASVGDDAWVGGDGLGARSGAYVALVQGGAPEAREAAAAALIDRIGRQPIRVPFVRVLPSEGRIAGTERYVATFDALKRYRPDLASDVYLLGEGGADAVLADYAQAGAQPLRLLVVEYQTPQLAADAERSLTTYYGALAPDAKQQRLFRREGNYLVEATGVVNRDAAQAVAGAVKYDVTIKMLEGPDPVTIRNLTEEAQKAALVFINSFAIVGLGFLIAVACGLVIGAVVFRRRRRASAEVFSDAGGMVHLDLKTVGGPRLRRAEPVGLLPSGPGD